MKYSIIIPSFNNKQLTETCLQSITLHTKGFDYEIIVVDDFSNDGAREFLRTQKDVLLIENKKNLGFSKTNNIGAKKATGDVLIFLNNDTEVQPGWLEGIDRVFRNEKNIGAVGVKLIFPNGLIQHAGVVISPDKVPRHIYYKKPKDFPPANIQRDYKVVTAACISIPKKVFEKIGGFNESFKNGLEDVDLCLRIFS